MKREHRRFSMIRGFSLIISPAPEYPPSHAVPAVIFIKTALHKTRVLGVIGA
jgi:hypothetical protein